MALTEVEMTILNRVVRRFLDQKATTPRRELVLDFEDPDAIDRLHSWQLLQTYDRTNYLPTAISFHYCGDPEVQALAGRSVQVVAHVFKNLYREEKPSLAPADIEEHARQLYDKIDEMTIRLGLYLAPDLRLVSGYQGRNYQQPDLTPLTINEQVVKLKNLDSLWDDYIRQYGVPFERERADIAPAPTVDSALGSEIEQSLTAGVSNEVPISESNETVSRPQTRASWVPRNWKIVQSLPEGGQGWTYLVKHTEGSDQQTCVLKRLKNKKRLARFNKEVDALRKLSHPGILRIIETSQPDEEPFYIAEYCEKGDLTKLDLSRRTLLSKLQLFREICDAMAAAHGTNIIHRDLKPQNILIRGDGSAALGDFGLCLDLGDLEERITSTAEAVGPRHYIAPELEDGRDPDPKPSSDCYSLGKLLYYILSGHSFARERHRDTSYDLRTFDADIRTFFVYELLDKTIATSPAARFQSAGELLKALDSVILRIEQNAHVLNMNVPQHCLYCISGRYQPITGVDSSQELRLICTNCGNIQFFAGGRPWWKPHTS